MLSEKKLEELYGKVVEKQDIMRRRWSGMGYADGLLDALRWVLEEDENELEESLEELE